MESHYVKMADRQWTWHDAMCLLLPEGLTSTWSAWSGKRIPISLCSLSSRARYPSTESSPKSRNGTVTCDGVPSVRLLSTAIAHENLFPFFGNTGLVQISMPSFYRISGMGQYPRQFDINTKIYLVNSSALDTHRVLVHSNDFTVLQNGFVFGSDGSQVDRH